MAPHSAHAFNNLGLCHLALNQLPTGADAFKRATQLRPSLSEAFFNLGSVLLKLSAYAEADAAFDGAIKTISHSATGLAGLGRALLGQGQLQKALDCAYAALMIDANNVQARILCAKALVQIGQADEALAHAERATALEPENASAFSVYALALQSLGQFSEAASSNRKAIELDPNHADSYVAIAFNQSAGDVDPSFVRHLEALAQSSTAAEGTREMLHYGLGRSYEQLGEYESSMKHYDEANRIARNLKLGNMPLNREMREGQIATLKNLFSPAVLKRFSGQGLPSNLPIFVVGMIRSGTTLMEQILSSHPSVGAAGECTFWMENAAGALDQTKVVNIESLRAIASEYLKVLAATSPGVRHITDKMPANTTFLGLIHIAFPNARVIHMTRNGADTCFSIYATPNAARADFLHDKENIAFEYQMHLDLMSHWRTVLPSDRFLDVSYEALVENPDAIVRQVLEFCDLEWSDLCLAPEKNKRLVATPSLWQVRQPLYKTSRQRWKNFERWLEPFRKFAND